MGQFPVLLMRACEVGSGVGSGEVVTTILLGSGEEEISWRGVRFRARCSADLVFEGIG